VITADTSVPTQAELALTSDETPVGCVFVRDGKIISRGMNDTNKSMNVGILPHTCAILVPSISHPLQPLSGWLCIVHCVYRSMIGHQTRRIHGHIPYPRAPTTRHPPFNGPLRDCRALRHVRIHAPPIRYPRCLFRLQQ
jgi:hypothetical protein